MTLHQYLTIARQPRYSLSFALPLLLIYEILAWSLSQSALLGVRNGADVLLKNVFVAFGGARGLAVFTMVLLAVGAWLVVRDRRRHPGRMDLRVYPAMLAESLAWAILLGVVVSRLTGLILHPPLAQVAAAAAEPVRLSLSAQLVLSLGAGLYEELLFRVLLVSGLLALGLALGWKRPTAVLVAIGLSALIFAAFHYVGPLGDPWAVPSFTFRAVAGVALSVLYVVRGFGIVAWSHALYDVMVSVAA